MTKDKIEVEICDCSPNEDVCAYCEVPFAEIPSMPKGFPILIPGSDGDGKIAYHRACDECLLGILLESRIVKELRESLMGRDHNHPI